MGIKGHFIGHYYYYYYRVGGVLYYYDSDRRLYHYIYTSATNIYSIIGDRLNYVKICKYFNFKSFIVKLKRDLNFLLDNQPRQI